NASSNRHERRGDPSRSVPTCGQLNSAGDRSMDTSAADELRAVLATYKQVADASWPGLNPQMAARSARWATASESELRAELEEYLREVTPPRSNVRIIWKTGPKFLYGGCNEGFAKDAGMA